MLQQSEHDSQIADGLAALSENGASILDLGGWRDQITPAVIRQLKEKVAHLIRADANRALRLAEVTRAAADVVDDPLAQALAYHTTAMVQHVSGRYADAIEAYDQAEAIYTRLGKEVESARVVRAKIDAMMYLSRYDEALRAAVWAQEVFERSQETLLLAQLEINVGNIYHRQDQYHEALKHYMLAEKTFAAQRNEFELAQVRFNKANQYTQLNDFDRALSLYEQAQQGYDMLGMPLMVNLVQYSIAWLYFLRGSYKESLKLFAKTKVRAQELGDVTLPALCDMDQAEIYLQLNAYEDALESARAAAEKFSQLQMSYEYAKARMYQGIAHTHLSEFAAAERELQAARAVFVTEGNDTYTALTNIYLSDVVVHKHDWEQVEQLCAEAERLFLEQGLLAKAAYTNLRMARLKLVQSDAMAAQSLCQSALQMIGQTEAPWLKYQCLHLLGNALRQAGQEQEAYESYLQAVDILEAMRSSIQVDEYKCTFLKDKLRVYEDLVDLCLLLGQDDKIDEAFTHVQAAKSRSLVELLASEREIAGKIQDPAVRQLYEKWKQLREELDYYYNRINQYESRGQQRPGWLGAELQEEVREREQQLAQLARRLRLEDEEYASLRSSMRLGLDQVQTCLAEDEVLLEYYIINDRVNVFALSRHEVRLFNDVTTAATAAPLLQWLKFNLDQFTLGDQLKPAQLEKFGAVTCQYLQKLYQALIAPLQSFIDGRKIIVAPHDFLHYVPFHALHDGQHYLIDRQEISYCPSANVFKLCSDKARTRPANGQMLIMGVPDQAAPLIREEVSAVKSLWPEARIFLDDEATLDQLKQHGPTARLVHLASHGVFRRDNPMFSALKLSDTWLNLYDVFNLDLNADLVTLSACETGMNEVFPGDELFGLMRGFLYAGAPSLIVSLWMVHDRSTATFMQWLYAGLREGLSKRAALRQAQLAVKEEYRHPYYWAPFILMGAPA